MEVPTPAPVQPITMTMQLSGPQVAYFPDRVTELTQQIPAAVAALVPPLGKPSKPSTPRGLGPNMPSCLMTKACRGSGRHPT